MGLIHFKEKVQLCSQCRYAPVAYLTAHSTTLSCFHTLGVGRCARKECVQAAPASRSFRRWAMISSCTKSRKAEIRFDWRSSSG